ncbi:MAG: cysteine desulfurase family protein [Galactobacter sp.]
MPADPVYLDHAATTPLSAPAREALEAHLGLVGNPSSLHTAGRRAHRMVEEGRERLAAALGVHPTELIMTSGGTEADNLGLKGAWWAARSKHPARDTIVVTGAEHHAVLDTVEWLVAHEGARMVQVPLLTGSARDGVVDLDAWTRTLRANADRVAVATLMWANNEVGTIQPVEQAADAAAEVGATFHTDAVQALGHVPVQLRAPGIASAAVTAHKLGGPVGIGALVLGRDQVPTPLIHGGGHQRGLRSGTLDVLGTVAFAAAAEHALQNMEAEAARLRALSARLISGVRSVAPDAVLNGPDPDLQGTQQRRLPGTVHFTFPGCEGDSVLFMLDMAGIATSTGSACTAGVAGPSHVLVAMGRSDDDARSVQRFSLGAGSTEGDVDAVLTALPGVLSAARAAGLNAASRTNAR